MTIEYAVLKRTHQKEAAALSAQQFAESEPLAKHLGLTAIDLIPVMEALIEATAPSQLQFVAIDDDTNEIVGCIFGKDLLEPIPESVGELCPALAPVFGIMDEVTREYREAHALQAKRKIAEGLVVAVRSDVRRRGIAMGFLAFAVPRVLRVGYTKGIVCLTSAATQRMGIDNLGIPIQAQVNCADFVYGGRKPFSGIKDLSAVVLVASSISI